MDKEKQYKIKDVGIDFTSLRDDYGTVTGTCDIYGEENGEETVDTRHFVREANGEIQIIGPFNDFFTAEDYAEAMQILAQNIKDNFESFLVCVKPLTEEEN